MMNRGYRLNSAQSVAAFAYNVNANNANFTDMLGMTSGNEMRGAQKGSSEIFPEYINPSQALGRKLKKKTMADRMTQTSVVNHPGSKMPNSGSQLTEGVMRSEGRTMPVSGQQWSMSNNSYGGVYSNFNEGLTSDDGIGRKSNPYKVTLDQSMPGDTHIMNPSPNVGNPYNLVKANEATYPTRIRKRTPVKTLRRGAV